MGYYGVCEVCKRRSAEHCHHLFSRTKWAVKKYKGRINHPANLMYLCSSCHLNKSIPKMSEQEFLEATKDWEVQ